MPHPQRYPIPAAEARAELRVANSRFIATIVPTPTVEAAKACIARIRGEFADASHNVFAYVVSYGATTTLGMSDDGEPSGTAGRPTLAVLRGSGLGDATVVVTRYFGGTLLGTGGLVRAYGDAARAVLELVPRAEKIEKRQILVAIPYPYYELVTRAITTRDGAILSQDFAAAITLTLSFAVEDIPTFLAELTELTAGQAEAIEI